MTCHPLLIVVLDGLLRLIGELVCIVGLASFEEGGIKRGFAFGINGIK